MDEDYFIFQQMEDERLEIEAEEESLQTVAGVLGAVLAGAEMSRVLCNERRQERRQYLVRAKLLDNLKVDTPWQQLFASRSDRAYITTMGFDVNTFNLILESGFEYTWLSASIPRPDTSCTGMPQLGRRSLDAPGALGLALHFLSSTMHDVSLQQIFALVPSTVSRYISFSLDVLLACLRRMPDARIKWPDDGPNGGDFQEYNDLILARHPRLIGAFAAIDGLNIPLKTSSDEDIENATYNGWLSEHFISSVLVFSPTGEIIDAMINAPGSWHDARVAQPIFKKLRTRTPEGYYLIADTAFPRGS